MSVLVRAGGDGPVATGTGTAIGERDVLTVQHLAESPGGDYVVTPSDRSPRRATAHCVDEEADLAHLVLSEGQAPLPHYTSVPTTPQRVAGGVVSFGRTSGIRSARFFVRKYSGKHSFSLDVESYQGDSGGGVFTKTGKLVGVVWGKRRGESLGTKRTGICDFLRRCRPSKAPVPDPPPPVQGPPGPPGADGQPGPPGTPADMSRVEALERLVARLDEIIAAQRQELDRLKNLRVGIDLTKPDGTTKRLKSGRLGDAKNGVFVAVDLIRESE